MGIVGGRRARQAAVGALLLALPALALGGCAAAVDHSRNVQTKIGRIAEVAQVAVVTPSPDRGAAIDVTYVGVDDPASLARLIAAVDGVADGEDYPAYRLTLRAQGGATGEELAVDGSFAGSNGETAILANWYRTTGALIGAVDDAVQPGAESLTVDSGGGAAHDVAEASRIGYGSSATSWIFRDGPAAFTAGGRVTPSDVVLFETVQRTVSSSGLAASAPGWQLDRRDGHLRLDLDVSFGAGAVPPTQLSLARYGGEVAPLFRAALAATHRDGVPVWIALHNPTATGPDDFGSWSSDQAPVRGRDQLGRGWDAWLAARATHLRRRS